jgi:hypothetical protein
MTRQSEYRKRKRDGRAVFRVELDQDQIIDALI